jgi:hypothetical protein
MDKKHMHQTPGHPPRGVGPEALDHD